MKWSKALSITAIGAVGALALAGCSSGDGGSGGDAGGDGDGGYELAFVQGVAGDEFYISMQCGVEAKAEELGVSVDTQGAKQFDPALQKPLVDSVVASSPDALLIAATDQSAMQAPIEAAANSGVEVVLVDTTVEDPSFAASAIASDNYGGGEAAFAAIEEAHPEGGKVLVVSIDPGITTSDARAEGFEAAVAENDKFESVGIEYSHNQPDEAARIVTAALQRDKDLVGIFAANLFAAEGTATGVQQAGRDDVTVVGFDAGPAQVEQLRDGIVQALVAQEPASIGEQAVEQAVAALDGEETTAEIQTGFTVITQDNIDGEGGEAVYQSTC
ncbi:ABC transporter substrate-binding protein [Microbacterium sp. JB110]|uniref:ABC transporter substrate-binding protein n=1 Tax=Microbacterium sp. JB110 TaxID=2024477 RepID=UPI00097EC0E5|nr:ABC transporter substrate-binding protein [Microbacterium sp. JB110]RCS60112.1 ribose ABC transporter substrate-binding protein [Microbacterium sp. JB110]SJM47372.1 ribose ABC transporter, periplasmic binding protein [Frigoribacterium sp. JB110]